MPYTPVPTKNTGDTFTANEFNTYIRDNFAAGVPDIFEANGDLAVGTGPDAATRLAVGNNWAILGVDPNAANKLAWRRGLFVAAKSTTTQTIQNNTITGLTMGLLGDSFGQCWDTTYNAIKLPVSLFNGCVFMLTGYAVFVAPPVGDSLLEIALQSTGNPASGNWVYQFAQSIPSIANRSMHLCVVGWWQVTADIWFRLSALQITGSSVGVYPATLRAIMIS